MIFWLISKFPMAAFVAFFALAMASGCPQNTLAFDQLTTDWFISIIFSMSDKFNFIPLKIM
jgi:hypothetical protein